MADVTGNGRIAKAQMWMEQNELNEAKRRNDVQAKQEGVATQSLRGGFQQMGEFNPQQPVLQTRNLEEMNRATRSQALGSDAAQIDPQKTMQSWNASPYEYWTEQLRANPESTYAIVNQMFASHETPEEKAKRERREALGETFRGLGSVIGNAAMLYSATKGGMPADINSVNEKHRERMQRIKDKQDALDEQRKQILINAKLGEIKTARAEALEERKAKRTSAEKANERAWKVKYDAYMKELDNAHKMGQIDAQTKAELAKQAARFKSDKELEAFKQQNRLALKDREDKIITSLTGSDGGTWTRNTSLSKEELRELSKYVEDWSPYTEVDEDGKKTTDYLGAIADASDSGLIPDYILEEKGFKRSKDSSRRKGKSLPGVETKGKSKHLNL